MRGFSYRGADVGAVLMEVPTPEPAAGELRVRIGATTVCGTDLRTMRGEKDKGIKPGVILGHEISGFVDAIGAGVTGFDEGDQVIVSASLFCGLCRQCQRGQENLCDRYQVVGHHYDGGLADHMLIPRAALEGELVLKAPRDLDPAEVALAEPISCCLNGLDNYRVELGDTVVIVGGGAIGLIHLQLAKLSGAQQVIVSDPSPSRRQQAELLGATRTVDPINEDLAAIVSDLTDGDGADVAVLCIGVPQLVDDCLRLVRKRGRVCIFAGLAGEGQSSIAANLIHYREISLVGSSNAGRRNVARALDLIVKGAIDTKTMVTHRFGLSRVAEAVEFAASGAGIKIAVVPD